MIETNKLKIYLILHPTEEELFLSWFYNKECTWTFSISEAKIFLKGSSAKSYITQISKKYKYIPRLLEISGGEYQIIDQEDRVKKSILDKEFYELNRQKVIQEETKKRLELELEEIQKRLNGLKNDNISL